MILALSGVEAIANITGVMKLDPGSTAEHPKVTRTAAEGDHAGGDRSGRRHGSARLGDAFAAARRFTPESDPALARTCCAFSASTTARVAVAPWFGSAFGLVVGVVFGLLLFSAVNTAVVALIGVIYMMAQDGEMPKQLARLNRHGVPRIPLFVAVAIPILVLAVTPKFEALAGLYAIGVVGAIAVNLGSCTFNKRLDLTWYQRLLMGVTFLILAAVELTIAKTKPDALFFAMCVLGIGLALARLLPQALRIKDRHDDQGSRGNGRARISPRRCSRSSKKGRKSWSRRAGSIRC